MLFEFSNQILAAKLNLEKPKKEFVSSKIVTDSRKISKGDCFLALKGPSFNGHDFICLLYTSPSPRDRTRSRMPSSA